jgi:hypothetical protein
MGTDARQAVVAGLIRLADSPDYRDRADAGRALASFAEEHSTHPVLLNLVLDTKNTFVIAETAEALLRRKDAVSLAIVSAAAAVADCDVTIWLYGAVHSVLGVFERDRDDAVRICQALADNPDQDDQVRTGAAQLVVELTDLQPVLKVIE